MMTRPGIRRLQEMKLNARIGYKSNTIKIIKGNLFNHLNYHL